MHHFLLSSKQELHAPGMAVGASKALASLSVSFCLLIYLVTVLQKATLFVVCGR